MVHTRSGTFYEFSDDEEENELDTPSPSNKRSVTGTSASKATDGNDENVAIASSASQPISVLFPPASDASSSLSLTTTTTSSSSFTSVVPKIRETSSSFFSVTSRLVRPFKSSSRSAAVEITAGNVSDEDDFSDSGADSHASTAPISANSASTSSSSRSSTSISTLFAKPRPPASSQTTSTSTVAAEVVEEPTISYHVISTSSGFLHPPTPPPTPSTVSSSSSTSSSFSAISSHSSTRRASLTQGASTITSSDGTAITTIPFSKSTLSEGSSEVADGGVAEYEYSLVSPVSARPAIHAKDGARIRDPQLRRTTTSSYSTHFSCPVLHSPGDTQPHASTPASLRSSTVIPKQPVEASASSSYVSVAPKSPAGYSPIISHSYTSVTSARKLSEGPRARQGASAYSYLASSATAKNSEAPSEEMSLTVDGLDVTTLSDDDLYEKLKGLGVPVGPIVASTRLIYQRKLATMIQGSDAVDAPTTNGDLDVSDTYSDSDGEAEEETRAETASHVSSHLSHVSSRTTTSSRPPSTTSTPSASRSGAADLRRRVLTSGGKSEVIETSPPAYAQESEVVYDPERHTPSPRRSLRTVTSTVTSNETVTYRKFLNNGKSYVAPPVETTVEEVEKPIPPSKLWMILRLLVKLLFLLIIIAVIYILYENMSTESPFAALEQAARNALESAIGNEPEGEGASPPPVGEDLSAQPREVPAE